MKIFIKTLKNTQFEIQANPDDTVANVKKNIENTQGKNLYPADQQMLIYQGKVLNDNMTMSESNVTDEKFIVIMLKKTKGSSSGASTTTTTAAPTSQASTQGSVPSTPSIAASATPVAPAGISSQAPPLTLPPTAMSAPPSTAAAAIFPAHRNSPPSQLNIAYSQPNPATFQPNPKISPGRAFPWVLLLPWLSSQAEAFFPGRTWVLPVFAAFSSCRVVC